MIAVSGEVPLAAVHEVGEPEVGVIYEVSQLLFEHFNQLIFVTINTVQGMKEETEVTREVLLAGPNELAFAVRALVNFLICSGLLLRVRDKAMGGVVPSELISS